MESGDGIEMPGPVRTRVETPPPTPAPDTIEKSYSVAGVSPVTRTKCVLPMKAGPRTSVAVD